MLHCHYPDANLLDHGTFTGSQLNCNIQVLLHAKYNRIFIPASSEHCSICSTSRDP